MHGAGVVRLVICMSVVRVHACVSELGVSACMVQVSGVVSGAGVRMVR